MSAKRVIAVSLFICLLCAAIGVFGVFYFLHLASADIEVGRNRLHDAATIRNALFDYKLEHAGAWPSSLADLKFDRTNVNLSPFRLLPAGSRVGEKDQDVIVEAPGGGNSGYTLYIYAGGEVSCEFAPKGTATPLQTKESVLKRPSSERREGDRAVEHGEESRR